MEAALNRLGLTWSQVYPIPMESCAKWLQNGAQEYLLDGGKSNPSVVEQSLEIMDRMGLTDEECKFLEDGNVAIHFKGIYDRFTRYIRENAITTECLQYNEFMRQLRKNDLYVCDRTVRMGNGDPKKTVVLDYEAMREKCDVDGFIKSQVVPL